MEKIEEKDVIMQEKKVFSLVASCAAGVEDLVAGEIKTFGGSVVKVARGVVNWSGDLESAYRTCLWSRYSSRILLQIGLFEAPNEDLLHSHVMAVDWKQHMDIDTTFAVECNLAGKANIHHSKFAALRVKDGVVDYFRERGEERPSVQVVRPDLQLNMHIDDKNMATLSIDLSGESMHRRGYRADGVMAPLKENLAAAIVALSGWCQGQEEKYLIDPMCGSGTLLIEAALMWGDSAPGLSRSYFGFFGWNLHDSSLWSKIIDEAVDRDDEGMEKRWPIIVGYDADPKAIAVARKNIAKAGLAEKIQVKQAPVSQLQKPGEDGLLVCNPPYGERLSERQEVAQLYKAMGRVFSTRFGGWRIGMFISNANLADNISMKWNERHSLFNGSISCRLLVGKPSAELEKSKFVWHLSEDQIEGLGQPFANRLRKNAKKILKWANKENIQCFRIYDKDLPEFNVSVDFYDKWIHVQEYAPPKTIDPKLAKDRFNLALSVIRDVFGARRERVFIKTRNRQKGKKQYEKQGEEKKMHVVQEGDSFFLVNFTDYLDTGLFLDHRPIRKQIGEIAQGKRFLNLFGYTGSATVHAGGGGASSTTTVDLSATYLDWAKMNLSLNGIEGPSHRLIRDDCVKWLAEEKGTYDLIFIDPPTFSNTKKERRVFDIQRDHVALIGDAMRILEKDGLLLFSTNFRRFILDQEVFEKFEVKDISSQSIPFDYKRNSQIHKCWEIRHA